MKFKELMGVPSGAMALNGTLGYGKRKCRFEGFKSSNRQLKVESSGVQSNQFNRDLRAFSNCGKLYAQFRSGSIGDLEKD